MTRPPEPVEHTPAFRRDEEPSLCPGICNARYRKLEAQSEAHNITPREGSPLWCINCAASIRFNLGRLPDLAAQVAERTDGQLNKARDQHEPVDTSPTVATRSLSPAWEHADDAINWAHAWAEALADHLGHHGPLRTTKSGVPIRNITETTRYLTNFLSAALCAPFAEDFGNEAVRMAGSLERAAGRDRYIQRLPLRCPHCSTRTMTRDDGASQIDCRRCDRSWPESDYERLAAMVIWERKQGA